MKKIFALSLLFLSGCATIISGSVQEVSIKHTGDAKAVITNSDNSIIYKGNIPATVSLSTGNGYFQKSTYHVDVLDKNNEHVGLGIIDSSLNNWYFGNLLVGGIIGMVLIDPFTGAMWTLPSEITIK